MTIVYNNMTPEQLQWQFVHQQSGGGLAAPPRPPQVSEKDWIEAVVRNPDPQAYIPSALVGAEALQARLGWQQERANALEKGAKALQSHQEDMQRRAEQYQQSLQDLKRMHDQIRKRMIAVMTKVELARCFNIPLQKDEIALAQRLAAIIKELDKASKAMDSLPPMPKIAQDKIALPNKEQLAQVLKGHREGLVQLSSSVQRDKMDIQVLQTKRLT